jgi:hypothetical protein
MFVARPHSLAPSHYPHARIHDSHRVSIKPRRSMPPGRCALPRSCAIVRRWPTGEAVAAKSLPIRAAPPPQGLAQEALPHQSTTVPYRACARGGSSRPVRLSVLFSRHRRGGRVDRDVRTRPCPNRGRENGHATGKTRDAIGAAIGVSGKTAERAAQVERAARRLEASRVGGLASGSTCDCGRTLGPCTRGRDQA